MGQNHIVTNVTTVGTLGYLSYNIERGQITVPEFLHNLNSYVFDKFKLDSFDFLNEFSFSFSNILSDAKSIGFILLLLVLLLFGTLVPDICSPNSMLGRYFYLPVGHRTITHAIWIPIALLLMSINWNIVLYVFLGYILHLFYDSFSVMGVCYLYPLTNYTPTTNSKVKSGSRLVFYRADGSLSELIFTSVIVCINIAIILLIVL